MTASPARHSVSVVVDDAGRALLTRRRDDGHWEPPGGVLELDESIPDGVRREVREETGLTVEPDRLTGIYKNMNRGIVALVFRCHTIAGDLTTTDETTAFHWASADELPDLMDEAYAVRVRDALDNPDTPRIREHNGVTLL